MQTLQMTEEKIPETTKQYWRNIGKDVRRINVDIPDQLWGKVGKEAETQGVKKRDIVIEALTEYLNNRR